MHILIIYLKRHYLFGLLPFALCCFSLLSEQLSIIDPPIRVAVIHIGEPFSYYENKESKGIYYDISLAMVKQLKVPYLIELVPYNRMLEGLNKGSYDCSMFFTSVERKKNYSQIGLVVKKSVIIVFNASKNGQSTKGFSHLNELANKVVGQVRGTTYSDEFSKNESIIKYEVSNYDEGLKMLSQGRLDAFIGSKELIESKFNHDGHYFTLIENETWLQCSKVSSNMTMKFQDKLKLALDNLKNHDEQKDIIVKIHKKYLTRYHRPN